MIDLILRYTLPAAYALLPPAMASREASALLLAIGLQESGFLTRRQRLGGPARGFWQFERGGGVHGVLTHPAVAFHIEAACSALVYRTPSGIREHELHAAIEHNDVLACVFARLLLWTLPDPLPGRDASGLGWAMYLSAWRPGRPHSDTWPAHYAEAWARVDEFEEAGS